MSKDQLAEITQILTQIAKKQNAIDKKINTHVYYSENQIKANQQRYEYQSKYVQDLIEAFGSVENRVINAEYITRKIIEIEQFFNELKEFMMNYKNKNGEIWK